MKYEIAYLDKNLNEIFFLENSFLFRAIYLAKKYLKLNAYAKQAIILKRGIEIRQYDK